MIDAAAWEVKPREDRIGQFEVGQRVFHEKYGYGAVRGTDRERLTVAFETGDKKVYRQLRQARLNEDNTAHDRTRAGAPRGRGRRRDPEPPRGA